MTVSGGRIMPAQGAFDLHLHAGPDLVPRRCDDLELANLAVEYGMSGFLLKAHHGSTVERAYLIGRLEPRLRVAGGITLNDWCGGFNPVAVELAIRLGARCVWMPTQSAANHVRHYGSKQGPSRNDGGLSVLDERGRIRPEVHDILALIAEADIILATGHLGADEIWPLFEAARAAGVKRFVVTHAEFYMVDLSVEAQKELARQGAYLEHCLLVVHPRGGHGGPENFDRIVASIRATGPEPHVIATDYGQADNPPPPAGMADFIQRLAAAGFRDDEIERMARHNALELVFGG
ncbi:MAG TPA: DUF6282 family protein [Bacillota bacterium]